MKAGIEVLESEIASTKDSYEYYRDRAERSGKQVAEALKEVKAKQLKIIELKKALAVLKNAETSQGGEGLS